MVPINYLAVLVAAVANMVIGSIWYGPLFGKKWVKLQGWSKDDMEKMKEKGMSKTYLLAFVGSLLMSFVLFHALVFAATYLNASGINAGVMAGFWNWLGFVAPVTLGMVLWEGKSWKLWFLQTGYYLVSLCVMGIILTTWV